MSLPISGSACDEADTALKHAATSKKRMLRSTEYGMSKLDCVGAHSVLGVTLIAGSDQSEKIRILMFNELAIEADF